MISRKSKPTDLDPNVEMKTLRRNLFSKDLTPCLQVWMSGLGISPRKVPGGEKFFES